MTGADLSKECSAIDLLKRPNISFAQIAELTGSEVSEQVGEQIEIAVKYEGYINRQHEDVAQLKRLEETKIPADFDYDVVSGLSREITQKLKLCVQKHWLKQVVFLVLPQLLFNL